MRKKTAKALYGSVIESGSGKLVYNLLNPISRQALSGRGGRMYRAIYVVNPMDGGAISRLQISEEDVSKLDGLSRIIISDTTGEVRAVRENGSVVFFGWCLYKIHAKQMVHLDGNPLNFRRENINIHDSREAVNQGKTDKGYWDMSFVGSTRALISLIIRDNPKQSWEQLVATVADIKGVPLQEAERRLKEFAAADMLGYHLRETYWDGNAYQEVEEWIAYEEKEVD